jgi:hypothetical protein
MNNLARILGTKRPRHDEGQNDDILDHLLSIDTTAIRLAIEKVEDVDTAKKVVQHLEVCQAQATEALTAKQLSAEVLRQVALSGNDLGRFLLRVTKKQFVKF